MTEHRWNDDHGPDGLYDKFEVRAKKDPRTVLGEDGEFVFVLRPERDEAAYHAMHTYAVAVAERSPGLSSEIIYQLARIELREAGRGS